jgi:hypothetical protein
VGWQKKKRKKGERQQRTHLPSPLLGFFGRRPYARLLRETREFGRARKGREIREKREERERGEREKERAKRSFACLCFGFFLTLFQLLGLC